MDKTKIAVEIFKLMIEKDWNFPYDPESEESQSDQWDNAATQRALRLASLLLEEKQ